MASNPYIADPNLDGEALDIVEVERIIAVDGKGFVKDHRSVMHFTRRVASTISRYKEQIQSLHGHLDRVATETRIGRPTTLSPLDAMRFASPEQKEAAFEGMQRDALRALRRAQDEARAGARDAVAVVNAVQFAATTILEDPHLDSYVRERFAKLLSEVQSQPVPAVPAAAVEPEPVAHQTPAPAPDSGLDDLFGDPQ